jgi:hypothetical protein
VSTNTVVTPARATPAPPEPNHDWRWAQPGIPLALAGVAGVLGAVGLGAKSFWHDEAFTALVVDLPPTASWRSPPGASSTRPSTT